MSNNNNVRATPDDQQPPQASASTNSATRAGDVFLDGVSQEMTAQSSANDNVEKFPREKVSESVRADSSGNQILWRVISDAPSRYNIKYVLAECACGTRREVQAADIRTGRSRSCRSCASTTHGHTKGRRSETFETWHSMIRRCADPGNHRYGGRGISVCDRWKIFENFLADMGERPSGLTLDRKDNSLGYYKDNCRWATRAEQVQNTSATRLTAGIVSEVRGSIEAGERQASVARRLGLTSSKVSEIWSRKIWANIP